MCEPIRPAAPVTSARFILMIGNLPVSQTCCQHVEEAASWQPDFQAKRGLQFFPHYQARQKFPGVRSNICIRRVAK